MGSERHGTPIGKVHIEQFQLNLSVKHLATLSCRRLAPAQHNQLKQGEDSARDRA